MFGCKLAAKRNNKRPARFAVNFCDVVLMTRTLFRFFFLIFSWYFKFETFEAKLSGNGNELNGLWNKLQI